MRRPTLAATLLATTLALLPPVGGLASAQAATNASSDPQAGPDSFWKWYGAYPTQQAAQTAAQGVKAALGADHVDTKIEHSHNGGKGQDPMWEVYYRTVDGPGPPLGPPGDAEVWHYYGSYRTKREAQAEANRLEAARPGTQTHITGAGGNGRAEQTMWVLYVQ